MEKLTDQDRLKPWMSFVLFAVGILYLVFVGSRMQTHWGTIGLVTSELGFLALALLFCVITRVSIKEVLPIKKITVGDFFGVIFLFAAGFLLSLVSIGISIVVLNSLGLTRVFKELSGLSDALFGNQPTFIVVVLTVAVIPAICEEAFVRGAIQSGFRGIKNDWVIILLVGLIFGIMHLSPLRFLNTVCLGAILAYVMVKKNNILLTMLMHFLNNLIASLSGFSNATQNVDIEALLNTVKPAKLLGIYLAMGFMAPLFLVIGASLLDRETKRNKSFVVAAVTSVVMLIGGLGLAIVPEFGSMMKGSVLNWNYTFTVTEDNLSEKNLAEAGIDIEEERTYILVVSAISAGADISFFVTDEDGEVILSKSANGMLAFSEKLDLKQGHYDLSFEGAENMKGKVFSYKVLMN